MLRERDSKVIWHPFTNPAFERAPIGIVSAEKQYLHTEEGRCIFDGISSWWVNLHGHSNPQIAEAIFEQAKKMEHVLFAGCTHEPAVRLAERLLEKLPRGFSKIFYSDNGSTAVEVALKMAIQYWRNRGEPRRRIVAFDQGYHGDTFGAMSVSGEGIFTEPYAEYLFKVERVPAPQRGCEDQAIAALAALLDHGDVAACIFEPLVLGAGGMVMYTADALNRLFACCRERGVLVIADEVMSGFGRTGNWFASLVSDESPDLMCLSKGITGGALALGVTACTTKIATEFEQPERRRTFYHGHSYTANPLACAAALASFDLLEGQESWRGIRSIEACHRAALEKLHSCEYLHDLRQCGTILAATVDDGGAGGYVSPLRERMYEFFLKRDLLLRPLGNVIYTMPPYCSSAEDLARVYEAWLNLSEVL